MIPGLRPVGTGTSPRPGPSSPVEDAIAAVARGEVVIVADDQARSDKGDLVVAADTVTAEQVAFFVRHTTGVISVGLEGERCDALRLPLMVPPEDGDDIDGIAFTVTVDLRNTTSAGVSAVDRAATIRALADPDHKTRDFKRPGHVFPVRCRAGGVLEHSGHPEAAVDLARLAGRAPAAMLCEVVLDSGDMARVADLAAFARTHRLQYVTIADLIAFRRRTEKLVTRIADARIPTEWGEFRCVAFRSIVNGAVHLAFVMGDVSQARDVLVRVQRECPVGDVFASIQCDCRPKLKEAMRLVGAAGTGAIIYLRGDEGRGTTMGHSLVSRESDDRWLSGAGDGFSQGRSVEDQYGIGAQILSDLGVTTMRLVTNSRHIYRGISGFGLEITGHVLLRHAAPSEARAGAEDSGRRSPSPA